MASFMQNWWDKHDMDRDGKGCFFMMLGCLGIVFVAGVGATLVGVYLLGKYS